MQTNSWIIEQSDGYKTKVYHYAVDKKPLASLLFLHGMAEHLHRYSKFASFLTEQGIDFYIYNHRGHGEDTAIDNLGYFKEKQGNEIVVNDAINILKNIKTKKRTDYLFLMGHSMGSLITRNVIQKYNSIDGVIICGTTYPSTVLSITGLFISSLIKLFKGPKYHSKFMDSLLFGGKLYKQLCSRTAYDWLTKDNSIVGRYIHDPYCGFICTAAFYNDLIKLAYNAGKAKNILLLPKNTPIFIISGSNDPVSHYGKEVKKLYDFYKASDYCDISCKLYENDGHEILNETDYENVMFDVVYWIKAHLEQRA